MSHHTVQRHVDVLQSIHLVRRLPPHFRNVGTRLTKAPKVCLRDSGLLHLLLNIGSHHELHDHPARGASWEGFVIEDIPRRERLAHPGSQAHFWRTAAGAEVDQVLDRGHERVANECKAGRGDQARAVQALRGCLPDLQPSRAWIIDQAPGIEAEGGGIARAGFEQGVAGWAWPGAAGRPGVGGPGNARTIRLAVERVRMHGAMARGSPGAGSPTPTCQAGKYGQPRCRSGGKRG